MTIKQLIGIHCEQILTERYYYNDIPEDIIKIYIFDGSRYYGIVSAEGDVIIHTSEDSPKNVRMDDYSYQINTLETEWACNCRVASVSYICTEWEKNGIVIYFDNGHNIAFYNTGYEDGDNDIFETDADIPKLKKKYRITIPSGSLRQGK